MKPNESQIPNPRKPWCRNCKAHTRYYEKIVAASTSGGPKVKHEFCEECEGRVLSGNIKWTFINNLN